MANRIKDALSPELYEYYKQNRNKYKRFASDLTLLQAKLFQGMVTEGVFPAKKHRYNWEYECDCVTWLNDVTKKICTFDDFRKLYKNRLKNYKFKSPEYYAECEKIVQENDVEFVKTSMKAKSMRNYVARNYSAPMPSQTKEHIDKKENSSVISSISERSSFQPHDDKYSYHIEEEKSYGGYATIPYIVTKHHKSNIMYFENRYEEWDAVQNVKQSLNLTWDKFYEKYQSYLTGMSPDSFEFKCQCLAIILEERKEIVALTPSPGHIVPNELISSGVTFKSWLYTAAGLIGSFFVLGGIAYVFKHLIALLWYLISWIGIILFNMVIWFFCLLFNLDGPEGMVDFENIVSPLKVWQIGGWIYGIIIVCILLWRFFTLLDKWGSKIFKT